MMNAIESKQYLSLNIIERLDGENVQKSLHSKVDFEVQDYVNNKYDVYIEEIEQKTLNIMECLGGENDQKSSYSSLNIIECLEGENDQKSLHSQADLEFQDYADNEFDVSIEEIEPKINTSYILSIEQKQMLKRSIIKYKPVSLKKPGLINNYTHVLRIKDDTTFFSKPYPVPIHYKEKVEKEINKMLKLGNINPSKNNYINSILIVSKTKNPFISSLDLTSNYWEIGLSEKSKQYNAFINLNHGI